MDHPVVIVLIYVRRVFFHFFSIAISELSTDNKKYKFMLPFLLTLDLLLCVFVSTAIARHLKYNYQQDASNFLPFILEKLQESCLHGYEQYVIIALGG